MANAKAEAPSPITILTSIYKEPIFEIIGRSADAT
jgi:hypothetical protein